MLNHHDNSRRYSQKQLHPEGRSSNREERWREVLARLPLPLLALAASYGVYSYAQIYVPGWIALVQAGAFELTYIGLSVIKNLELSQQRRARKIGLGAVIVSIIYNSLAGLFERRPDLLHEVPLPVEVVLAALHGAPLAWVAYLVADLLLHSKSSYHPQGDIDHEAVEEEEGTATDENPIDFLGKDITEMGLAQSSFSSQPELIALPGNGRSFASNTASLEVVVKDYAQQTQDWLGEELSQLKAALIETNRQLLQATEGTNPMVEHSLYVQVCAERDNLHARYTQLHAQWVQQAQEIVQARTALRLVTEDFPESEIKKVIAAYRSGRSGLSIEEVMVQIRQVFALLPEQFSTEAEPEEHTPDANQ